jgi:hypothetical protein
MTDGTRPTLSRITYILAVAAFLYLLVHVHNRLLYPLIILATLSVVRFGNGRKSDWVRKLSRRLLGTILLFLACASITLDTLHLPGPSEHLSGAVLIYLELALISYFIVRPCWLWRPIPLPNKCATLLIGAVAVVVAWLWLDSAPIAFFGPITFTSNQRAWQDGSVALWPHSFRVAGNEADREPQQSGWMAIDDERWLNADTLVSSDFGEARPLRHSCPDISSPDFDRQVKSKQCSIIFICGTGSEFLFVGWAVKNQRRQTGEDIGTGVQEISKRISLLYGPRNTFFVHGGSCFDPVAYFRGSGLTRHASENPLAAIATNLKTTRPLSEISIPELLWSDLRIAPTDPARKYSHAFAMQLTNSQIPELLLQIYDPEFSGSAGSPIAVYERQPEAERGEKNSFHYRLLLNSVGGPGGVHILDSTTNGYKDLLIDGSDGGSELKFDGTTYKEAECFSHDHNNTNNIRLAQCP